MADSRPETYYALNALRGVAAIGVLVFHMRHVIGVNVISRGHLAVDLFFLLSGFVIAHAYDRKLIGGMSFAGFMRVRLIRFYPLYLLGLGVGLLRVALLIVHGDPSFSMLDPLIILPFALLFLPAPPTGYAGDTLYPLEPPAWSLGVELIVNGVFAAFHRRFTTVTLVVTIAIAGLLLVVTHLAGHDATGGASWHGAWSGPLRASFAFPLGVLIYRFRDRLPALPIPPMAGPLLLAVALVTPARMLGFGYDLLFIFLLAPAILVISVAQPAPGWRPFCTWLGRTSYPLYTLHDQAIIIANNAGRVIGVPPQLLVGVLVVGLLSICWYLDVVDQRFRRSLGARRAEMAAP